MALLGAVGYPWSRHAEWRRNHPPPRKIVLRRGVPGGRSAGGRQKEVAREALDDPDGWLPIAWERAADDPSFGAEADELMTWYRTADRETWPA
jgi:hypothetical protein